MTTTDHHEEKRTYFLGEMAKQDLTGKLFNVEENRFTEASERGLRTFTTWRAFEIL